MKEEHKCGECKKTTCKFTAKVKAFFKKEKETIQKIFRRK